MQWLCSPERRWPGACVRDAARCSRCHAPAAAIKHAVMRALAAAAAEGIGGAFPQTMAGSKAGRGRLQGYYLITSVVSSRALLIRAARTTDSHPNTHSSTCCSQSPHHEDRQRAGNCQRPAVRRGLQRGARAGVWHDRRAGGARARHAAGAARPRFQRCRAQWLQEQPGRWQCSPWALSVHCGAPIGAVRRHSRWVSAGARATPAARAHLAAAARSAWWRIRPPRAPCPHGARVPLSERRAGAPRALGPHACARSPSHKNPTLSKCPLKRAPDPPHPRPALQISFSAHHRYPDSALHRLPRPVSAVIACVPPAAGRARMPPCAPGVGTGAAAAAPGRAPHLRPRRPTTGVRARRPARRTALNPCFALDAEPPCPRRAPPRSSYVAASYVKWVEAAGGRVIPIR